MDLRCGFRRYAMSVSAAERRSSTSLLSGMGNVAAHDGVMHLLLPSARSDLLEKGMVGQAQLEAGPAKARIAKRLSISRSRCYAELRSHSPSADMLGTKQYTRRNAVQTLLLVSSLIYFFDREARRVEEGD
jgi:hypothetical protein